jgi:hypothetical protein
MPKQVWLYLTALLYDRTSSGIVNLLSGLSSARLVCHTRRMNRYCQIKWGACPVSAQYGILTA